MEDIKDVTDDSLKWALDTISEKGSQRITAESIGPDGGKMVILLSRHPTAIDREDVEVQRESPLCKH